MATRLRKFKQEEELLEKANTETAFTEKEEDFFSRMISEGILEKRGDEYMFTKYGEMIKVTGYETHYKNQRFERSLPFYTGKKVKVMTSLLILILSTIVIILLFLVLGNWFT